MAKLIQLQEAAKLLGMTPEELNEMRSRNEIFGYRDGSTWKFKMQEIERVASERGVTLGSATPAPEVENLEEIDLTDDSTEKQPSGSDSEDNVDALDDVDALDGDATSDSILVSEEELGRSDDTTSSTIIGSSDSLAPHDSDIQLAPPGESGVGTDLKLAGSSDIDLSLDSSDVLSKEAGGEGKASDTNIVLGTASSDAELTLEGGGSELKLAADDSEPDVAAGGSGSVASASSSGFGSAIDLDLNDDELVLGSDVTGGSGDSGINLTNPSDSGLSLEQPLDLAGSSVESLELGEDDMMLSLDEEADPDLATELQADDDFLLTPMEGEEAEDSGSQVIALDADEFDAEEATVLGDAASMLEEEAVDFEAVGEEDVDMAAPALAGAAPGLAKEVVEASYSIWNVLSLFCIVFFLSFTGILMLDLINNIWSWDGTYSFNSAIMDKVLEMVGG